jgi:hypothetical protein
VTVCEAVMTRELSGALEERGYEVFLEVPMLQKRIDLVARQDGQIIAIEAKVRDWGRAFRQALRYRLCADEVYIAVSREFSHRVDLELLAQYGIGLIEMGDAPRYLLASKRNWTVHRTIRDDLLRYIAGDSPSSRRGA